MNDGGWVDFAPQRCGVSLATHPASLITQLAGQPQEDLLQRLRADAQLADRDAALLRPGRRLGQQRRRHRRSGRDRRPVRPAGPGARRAATPARRRCRGRPWSRAAPSSPARRRRGAGSPGRRAPPAGPGRRWRCGRPGARPPPSSGSSSSTVTPRARSDRMIVPGRPPRLRVHAGGRLVQEDQLRPADQRQRQRQPLLLAAGEPPIAASRSTSPRPTRSSRRPGGSGFG